MKSALIRDDQHITVKIDDQILFHDTISHWNDAFCRLLSLDEDLLLEFVEQASIDWALGKSRDAVTSLSQTWNRLRGDLDADDPQIQPIEWCGVLRDDMKFATLRIRESPDFGLAVSSQAHHGWLIKKESGLRATSSEVQYEDVYFEGSNGLVGYGSYRSQEGWRMEKAKRQVREIESLFMHLGRKRNFPEQRLLDVGSGYGYFQIAAEDSGWSTVGIELSEHASSVSKQHVKGDVFTGTLEEFELGNTERFDAIVMWDFIEHVDQPIDALVTAQKLLTEQGLLFIRTPNLDAAEFRIFGGDYHSLKLEHLHLFSPFSSCDALHSAGLAPELILSASHLLDGFRFFDSKKMAATLGGSDLFICASRK